MGDFLQERQDAIYTNADQVVVTRKVQGDTNNRYQQRADGDMEWGSGSATPDVVLGRSEAGVLTMTGSIANRVIDVTAATLAVTAQSHNNAIITLNRAAGVTVTLPAATGSGLSLKFVTLTTVTSNNNVIQVTGNDIMTGVALVAQDGGDGELAFETAADTDTITMNGSTKGGIRGDLIELIDVAADTWYVRCTLTATGTEATPFSAAV